ncbi:MAG: ribonuclease D [Lewinellaceae bacterium]|nr:ribonuclease D [Saprospiraceae bacterium]MCB9311375.1 ribonuclease D [Lewinellaceae bacterium]HRW74648.1 ribonuclease D [Saprospiraceae bacterium]
MSSSSPSDLPVILLDQPAQLEDLWRRLDRSDWFGFDTEFIGERRDIPLICLIQLITDEAIYLIDPLHATGWERLGDYIASERILKLTHAGENDYRLIYQLLDILPRNVFDLQVAVAFMGIRYPASLSTILSEVLDQPTSKGFTIADWTIRPLPPKMVRYAVEDVKFLWQLYEVVRAKLEQSGRYAWAEDEMKQWEQEDMYTTDPLKKLLHQRAIAGFPEQEKIFMLRIGQWRMQEAERTGEKEEAILSSKQIVEIARAIHSGAEALFRSRILPKAFIRRMADQLMSWYQTPPTAEELKLVYYYTPREAVDPVNEAHAMLVYQILQIYCMEESIAVDMVMPPSEMKRYRMFSDYQAPVFDHGWRSEFLPLQVRSLLENRLNIRLSVQANGLLLTTAS